MMVSHEEMSGITKTRFTLVYDRSNDGKEEKIDFMSLVRLLKKHKDVLTIKRVLLSKDIDGKTKDYELRVKCPNQKLGKYELSVDMKIHAGETRETVNSSYMVKNPVDRNEYSFAYRDNHKSGYIYITSKDGHKVLAGNAIDLDFVSDLERLTAYKELDV